MTWKYAFSSCVGTSHTVSGLPCQDASACFCLEVGDSLVIVGIASDGAGSATFSQIGATVVCEFITQAVHDFFANGAIVSDIDREYADHLIDSVQCELNKQAAILETNIRELACTLLISIIGEEDQAFFQIGDGAMVVASREEPEEYSWIFWPEKGEYANQTYFITELTAKQNLHFETSRRPIDEFALFTDGIENLALDFSEQASFQGFFRPLFAILRDSGNASVAELSDELGHFLQSPGVNDRTDDDKSLIIASRRHSPQIAS